MRRSLFLPVLFGVAFVASTAIATVTEPNGQQVPVDSMNGETQLYSVFQAQGDPVDWQADAASTPNSFSPLCGFTATFLLHESSCQMAFAWYNETGVQPQASDLHVIIPAGSAVGQTFTGTDIKNDPAYAGGLVGFAILTNNGFCSQNHYSNPAWNPLHSSGQPWVAAVIYPSKTLPNAYYIGFEDGPMVGASFNNDGDFNDDVFLVQGVTCSGGGQPCDTGLPGICGPGVTQCTSNGITCVGVSSPAGESCNNIDDDCNGLTDDGDLCPPSKVCDHGTCVAQCGIEFPCAPGTVCNGSGLCVDPACATTECEAGKVCVGGVCKAPCDDVVCPFGEVCRNGSCVDPCLGVTCDAATQVCDAGVCVAKCSCLPCSGGNACDSMSGHCVEAACVGKSCPTGEHCTAGNCVDDCTNAVCPAGQICQMGGCVPDPNATTSSTSDSTGALQPTTVSSGAGTGSSVGGASTASSATGSGGTGGGNGNGSSSGGCGCRIDSSAPANGAVIAALALAIGALRRRKRG
ncbi:MAG: MYXO-CTERM sorting domain-containing protein [Polyangiaceae bacterium]